MNISLRALRYVVATAESGNLTEAARRLNVSQPSISAAIAQFEAGCGVQIFVRHHAKGVTTTIAGTRIINEARLLLNHARDFGQNARAMADEVRGEIAVGCFWTIATHFMPSLLSGFAESHPGITVSLDEGDQQLILDALISGRTEIALSYEFARPEEIVAEPLAELAPYAVLHAEHPLAQARQRQHGGFARRAVHPARPAALARLLHEPVPLGRHRAAHRLPLARL